jgi:hypothetical protein
LSPDKSHNSSRSHSSSRPSYLKERSHGEVVDEVLDKVLDDVLDEVVGEVVDRSSNLIYPIYYHHNVIYLYSRRREQKSIFHTQPLS